MNEMYREKADKIANYKTYTEKRKVDALLELNADQYCNLGTESTKSEWTNAELTSRYIFRLIKNYDTRLGKMLLRDSMQG
jgi:hypothetical protein